MNNNDRLKEKTIRLTNGFLKTESNFNTNAPPFEIRGCKIILGGAFLSQRGANWV
jgi:hypothetical protein